MTGDHDPVAANAGVPTENRTATVRTIHPDADVVAAALAPDNTDSMDSRVDGDAVECTIERGTTGGLRSTVDDYVVNLQVAERIVERAHTHRDTNSFDGERPRTDDDRSQADPGDRSDANDGGRLRPNDGRRPRDDGSNTNT